MYLFQIFRSFLPLRNPIGFGASDFVLLAIGILLVCLMLLAFWLAPYARSLAARTPVCAGVLFVFAILLRVAILPQMPEPLPRTAVDFSKLLMADTLTHFRLANATPSLPRFFEAPLILQEPVYGSVFPWGQALALAAGEVIFRNSWTGMLLGAALLSALSYWMLRFFIPLLWAFCGGTLTLFSFGPLSPWTNGYSGDALAASAGCLLLGSVLRLRQSTSGLLPLLLGIAAVVLIAAQPVGGTLFVLIAATCGVLTARHSVRSHRKAWLIAAVLALSALVLTIWQYKLTGVFAKTNWPVLFFSLFLLFCFGLLTRTDSKSRMYLVLPCFAFFAFWYLLVLCGGSSLPIAQYESWYALKSDRTAQSAIERSLERLPGKQLVFVRRSPFGSSDEAWVHNGADIDSAKVVWANDLGGENQKLIRYYPDRKAWLLEPDARPPVLLPVH